jgi:hypothetical protein
LCEVGPELLMYINFRLQMSDAAVSRTCEVWMVVLEDEGPECNFLTCGNI